MSNFEVQMPAATHSPSTFDIPCSIFDICIVETPASSAVSAGGWKESISRLSETIMQTVSERTMAFDPMVRPVSAAPLADRLERGDLIDYRECPFSFLDDEDHAFLLQQRISSSLHKNISYDPATKKLTGHRRVSSEQSAQLAGILDRFSERIEMWLAGQLPAYAASWRRERVSLSPEEEVTRCLRLTARNDLLHIDAFPTRPTRGWRILRFFVNISPQDPRIWVTSDRFAHLLERYGAQARLPGHLRSGWWTKLRRNVLGAIHPGRRRISPYDDFMHRLHDILKMNDNFQDKSSRRLWTFAPGSAWMFFTDGLSYANLRGRFLLDQTFLIPPHALACPEHAPLELLRQACATTYKT